jgi:hypothetical protein
VIVVTGIRKTRTWNNCNLLIAAQQSFGCVRVSIPSCHVTYLLVASRVSSRGCSSVMSQSPSPSLSGQLSPSDAKDDCASQERIANTNSARQERLAALERRLNRSNTNEENPTSQGPLPFDDNHAKRTEFRRLVDPGITRPNSKEVALRSLRVNLKFFCPSVCCSREGMIHFFLFSYFYIDLV